MVNAYYGNQKTIGVLIAAYNEEKQIQTIIRRIPTFVDEILVVDDGSLDKTRKEALKTGATVITHRRNQGKGMAIRTGINHLKTDIIVFLDADGQHRPEEIPILVAPLLQGQADLVIGSRLFVGFGNMPRIRVLSSVITRALIRLRTGVHIHDTQCGFRAILRTHLQKMKLRSSRYEIESEMLLAAIKNKLRIKEVPISMTYGDEESYFGGKDVLNFIKSVISG
ncbi:MAG: glycosyltransferase family 2 protein [Candidatus Heimdallarchaeota archaeon]